MAAYPREEDQNQRELRHANQREEFPRTAQSENGLSEEESAAIAARNSSKENKR